MSVMNSAILIPEERIMDKIYLIRDQKVMLDRDLAILFSVKAIRLREQVKRNPDKFPIHFMFQLTKSEVDTMRLSEKAASSFYIRLLKSDCNLKSRATNPDNRVLSQRLGFLGMI